MVFNIYSSLRPRQRDTDGRGAKPVSPPMSSRQRRQVLRSRQPGSFVVAAGATFGGEKFAFVYFEGLVFDGLPFVET